MGIGAECFVTGTGRRVLTTDGQPGMDGKAGVGSTTEKQQGLVAGAIYANCGQLDDRQLDEIIGWVRLYKMDGNLFKPKLADHYQDLTKGGKFDLELTQEEACVALKIHDYGVDTITDNEKAILHSIIGKLKDRIWP